MTTGRRPFGLGWRIGRGAAVRIAAAITVTLLFLAGLLDPLDHALGDARFLLATRAATRDVVLVDIDEQSIKAFGTWPWSRTVYASIVDALLHFEADSIAVDVDLSSASTPDGDRAFVAALKRAEGSVLLAALQQPANALPGAPYLASLPLPIFSADSFAASVDVYPDGDGSVRSMVRTEAFGPGRIPSLSAQLALPVVDGAAPPFLIDFGIDASEIAHVSAVDLVEGRVAKKQIEGRKALVGAPAIELRDTFRVPRFGQISGPLLQALAADSLLQGRALERPDPRLGAALALLLLAAVGASACRLKLAGHLFVLAAAGCLVETAAVLVQSRWPIEPATAPLHAGLLLFGLIAVAAEIDHRRVRILQSRAEAERLRAILDRVVADNFAGVVVVDHDGVVRALSAAAATALDLPQDRGLHGHFADILPSPLADTVALALAGATARTWQREPAREVHWEADPQTRIVFDCVTTVSRVPGPVGSRGRLGPEGFAVCLSFEDVTEKRAAQAKLAAMATIDGLTGLANRYALVEATMHALARAARDEAQSVALVCFDLDRFKVVNHRLGHAGGDALLVAVGNRLREATLPGDLAARLGGDEFALLIERETEDEVRRFAEALPATIGGVHVIGPYQASVGVSVGFAIAASAGAGEGAAVDGTALMRDADAALTQAKAAGGDRTVLFDAALERLAEAERALEQDLRDGLERGEFEVFYQRQVDLATGLISGVEALIRWRHPRNGYVSPARFIPAAERTGLIVPLGAWVLRQACRDALAWPLPIKVSVNLSAVQLSRGDLLATVLDALAVSGLPAERLELELTESLLMDNDGLARQLLDDLRAAKIHLALDDFGTGYSSLSYLRAFAIDKVKIDQCFVRDLPSDQSSVAIIRAVVGLGRGLGLRVNAEGCETNEQLQLLRELGCDEVQGYLHGRPEPAAAIAASLMAQRDSAGAALAG